MKRELTEVILSNSDFETQQLKWLEELAELQQAIARADDMLNIEEEMADVYVCLDQMECLFNMSHETLMTFAEAKQTRTIERLKLRND